MPLRPLAVAVVMAALLALAGSAAAQPLPGTNGRILYIDGPTFATAGLVFTSDFAGTTSPPTSINTGLTQQHRHPSWSPDRTKIAFAEGAGGASGFNIYVLDLTQPNATPQNITNTSNVPNDRPAWSPDGTRIAYENATDIMVHPLNGGSDINLTSTLATKAFKAAWSPDSQTVYYSVGDFSVAPNGNTNDVRLYQEPANGSVTTGTELLHVSGAHVMQPSISPDGSKLCYSRSTAAGNSTTLQVVEASLATPGSTTTIANSGAGDYNCDWSPDGSKIVYTEGFGANGEIFFNSSDGMDIPINVSHTPTGFSYNPVWAPDSPPTCSDSTATTKEDTPVEIDADCNDTGPQYEQSTVRAFIESQPSHGKVEQQFAGDPITYTPNAGFSGNDSFQVRSFDKFGFGSDKGTVTVTVTPALRCGHKKVTIFGTPAGETLNGTNGPDVFAAFGGKDKIRGRGGNDIVCGGGGNDSINAGSGNDLVFGQGGNDSIKGGSGRDTLNGGSGKDKIRGEGGRDKLNGNSGRDSLDGGKSRDRCNGGSGHDRGKRCEIRKSIP